MRRAAEGEAALVIPVVSSGGSYLGASVAGDGISMEGGNDVLEALALMTEHNVDFADAYLAAVTARRREPVATLDADFRRLGVQLFAL